MGENERYTTPLYETSDPHAARPYFDINAAIIVIIVILLVAFVAQWRATASLTLTNAPAPISTPAIPAPADAPIYYRPMPTPLSIERQPQPIAQPSDNSDNRICVLVVDCGK